jgi:cytochrome c biogenesis protein CcdA/thiol-disulfide isomerase/thioredoxin
MFLLFGAFIAGALTVLAPCVLPLLPIVIGGSVTGNNKDKKRPVIIAVSLAVSLIVFTLLLKATTVFINVPPQVITYFSGGVIIALGIVMLFPAAYAVAISRLGIEQRAQAALSKGYTSKGSLAGPIIIGAALGPVFSSCSPVYAYILATVLPVNFAQAFGYIVAYVVGLAIVLLLIGYYGQRFTSRIRFASNPKGWFQRTVAILFIVVGLLVSTGYDKRLQTWVSMHTPFNFDAISTHFLPERTHKVVDGTLLNVTPYSAPEFVGLQDWINSQPLTMRQLKGKVVLVDFWTYSCINCIRNNPYLEQWYNTYKDDGFVVVGVHAPEFSFEKVPANVRKGVKDQHITYPVALDNDLATWSAFENAYWPAGYLIDAQGQVRRVHEGEGQYKETEEAIRSLLQENGAKLDSPATIKDVAVPITSQQTPETYVGYARAANYAGTQPLADKPTQTFILPDRLGLNYWALGGTWEVQGEKIIARGNSVLRFNVSAKDVYVVGGTGTAASVKILLNGQPASQTGAAAPDVHDSVVAFDGSRLYRLLSFKTFTSGQIIELQVPDGVELNAFTFGS